MKDTRALLAGLAGLLLLAAFVYAPGLRGDFLFDDFVNLDAIGATGPVDDWATFWRYLTSGDADPIGRPLTLLSFLLDARDWPAEPGPFLRTNLLIHLLNGALLALLLRRLGEVLRRPGREANNAALLAAGLWLLHPLLVSTTLYAVQRGAMLAATCNFAGLLAYVSCRERHARQGGWGPLAGAMLAIGGGTVLGVACKANGALLPVLALALEATVLRKLPRPAPRALDWLLLYLPTLLILGYLAASLQNWQVPFVERGWSTSQRLLSQPRALFDYLGLWFVPRAMSSGLYNDNFPVSTSLLSPWTTLPALLALIAGVAAAWRWRDARPALAAAIAFFLAGHLLESSTLPLELYFEHRNYLPAALLLWPPALALCAWQGRPALRIGIAVLALLLFALTTLQRASAWSDPAVMARAWALQDPGSARAQATSALLAISAGHPEEAKARLGPLWQKQPRELQLAFNYINAACAHGGITREEAARLETTMVTAPRGTRLMNPWLTRVIDSAADEECAGLDFAVVHRLLDAMARNPAMAEAAVRDQEIEPLRGRLALREGDAVAAREHFDRGLRAFVTPDVAARQAAELARAGAYAQALAHLDEYERVRERAARPRFGMGRVHAWVLERQGYWPREMAELRRKLHEEIAAAPPADAR